MKSSSPKCYMSFWDMAIYSDTLNSPDITPICDFMIELNVNRGALLLVHKLFCILHLLPHLTLLKISEAFVAIGAANQQRSLALPETWSYPIWDLHLF